MPRTCNREAAAAILAHNAERLKATGEGSRRGEYCLDLHNVFVREAIDAVEAEIARIQRSHRGVFAERWRDACVCYSVR